MDKKTILDALARDAFEKGGFNGTWLYAEHGGIVSKGAVGWRDPEDREPLREDCLFDLASVSKQFTAAAVMLLRRAGLLSLDDEITKFYPDEVDLRDGDLYVKWMRGHGAGFDWKLYPLGGNEFGIKKFDFTIRFSEGQLTCFDEVYKKL